MNKYKSLSNLLPGEKGEVILLTTQGKMRRRLQDIGLIQGAKVECLQVSPLGDPVAFLIRGAVIALRSEDSSGIELII